MRRIFGLGIIGVVAAIAVAQVSTAGALSSLGKALNSAKSLKAEYTVQIIGGAPDRYTVTFAKPNLVRIDSPNQLIVADGKTITTYDKGDNTYYKRPETDADVKALLSPDETNVWAGFFDENAYKPVSSRTLGERTRKGMTLSAVEATYDSKGRKVVTYYLAPTDNVVRQAEILLNDPKGKVTSILNTTSIALNGDVSPNLFAFNPPTDSRELSLDEINAGKWYTDLGEAEKAASASGKKIFVDFMATWCGPCKMLDRECLQTERFKAYAKKLVLLRIDVDQQPSVTSHYGVDAMPTQMVLASDGSVVASIVGYGDPNRFFSFLDGALSR